MAEQPERTFLVDGAFLRREANSAVRTFFAPIAAVVRAVAANSRPEEPKDHPKRSAQGQ